MASVVDNNIVGTSQAMHTSWEARELKPPIYACLAHLKRDSNIRSCRGGAAGARILRAEAQEEGFWRQSHVGTQIHRQASPVPK